MKEEQNVKQSLQEEITHLKRVVAGQKGRLQQMSADNERLNRVIKEKDMAIQGLEYQVRDMSEIMKKQANRIEELKGDTAIAEANLEYYKSLPWWKKILQ
jgi:predicted  nucleic acid-binding Zn-ribbon protein